jgi:hypothetical protein
MVFPLSPVSRALTAAIPASSLAPNLHSPLYDLSGLFAMLILVSRITRAQTSVSP